MSNANHFSFIINRSLGLVVCGIVVCLNFKPWPISHAHTHISHLFRANNLKQRGVTASDGVKEKSRCLFWIFAFTTFCLQSFPAWFSAFVPFHFISNSFNDNDNFLGPNIMKTYVFSFGCRTVYESGYEEFRTSGKFIWVTQLSDKMRSSWTYFAFSFSYSQQNEKETKKENSHNNQTPRDDCKLRRWYFIRMTTKRTEKYNDESPRTHFYSSHILRCHANTLSLNWKRKWNALSFYYTFRFLSLLFWIPALAQVWQVLPIFFSFKINRSIYFIFKMSLLFTRHSSKSVNVFTAICPMCVIAFDKLLVNQKTVWTKWVQVNSFIVSKRILTLLTQSLCVRWCN